MVYPSFSIPDTRSRSICVFSRISMDTRLSIHLFDSLSFPCEWSFVHQLIQVHTFEHVISHFLSPALSQCTPTRVWDGLVSLLLALIGPLPRTVLGGEPLPYTLSALIRRIRLSDSLHQLYWQPERERMLGIELLHCFSRSGSVGIADRI
jgi:hypothetical protein